MKRILICFSLILFLFACASPQDKQRKVAEKREPIYNAIEQGNLSKLKEAVGKNDLEGQSELHNLLVLNSCNRLTSKTNEDIAKFLVDKGAKPIEKEADHPEIIGSSFTLSAPIAGLLERSDCVPLLKFYLDNMSSKDVARAANNFKGKTSSDIFSWNSKYPKEARAMQDFHLQNSPIVYRNLAELAMKNKRLCNQKKEANCKALDNLQQEIAVMRKGIVDVAFINACGAATQAQAEEELMKKQVEFGEKTGVASPKTYDLHARQAQVERDDLAFYNAVLKFETGFDFDPKLCPPGL